MIKFLLSFAAVMVLGTADAYAQKADNPQSDAKKMMMQYDFNQDGKVSEREFIIGDGEGGYRAHLSNMHKSLDIKDISVQQYWFVEVINPARYGEDLKSYFAYMDKDKDGYIAVETYENTFAGSYLAKSAEKYARAIDVNGDNKISEDEYIHFDFTTFPSGSHEVFRNLDRDGNAVLDKEEFRKFFSLFYSEW